MPISNYSADAPSRWPRNPIERYYEGYHPSRFRTNQAQSHEVEEEVAVPTEFHIQLTTKPCDGFFFPWRLDILVAEIRWIADARVEGLTLRLREHAALQDPRAFSWTCVGDTCGVKLHAGVLVIIAVLGKPAITRTHVENGSEAGSMIMNGLPEEPDNLRGSLDL